MKKVFISLLAGVLLILTFTLCACGDDKGGTYYPTWDEMKTNLENGGYTVTVTYDLEDKGETHLSATKDNEYIEFYWLDDAADCDYFYNLLYVIPTNYNSIVKIENDEKFGNIVYCGTENAVKVAGIKVVDVKVKV
ncbi:MAG: hypothetical protein NC037_05945 [Bacteroides sp.]|nr:hypothetical protein [Bacillota bacterium]MCM1394124.1 hypothetical protein [[Eubacterium] siraeum]MCM1456046.1 hypothetical protein [Bacteroides sp.]